MRKVLLILMAVSVLSAAVAHNVRDTSLIVLGSVVLGVACLPVFMRRGYDPREPLTLVIASVFMGVTLKLWWIGLIGSNSPELSKRVLFGRSPGILLTGTLAILLGVICLVAGYSVRLRPVKVGHLAVFRRKHWKPRALFRVFAVLTIAGVSSFFLFILGTGGKLGAINELSQKRFNDLEGGPGTRIFTSNYLWFRLASLARYPLYLAAAALLWSKRSVPLSIRALTVIASLLVVAVGFYASNRAGILLVAVDILCIAYLIRGRIVARTAVMPVAAIVFVVIAVVMFRPATQDVSFLEASERTVFGRDLMDVTKTSFIVDFDEVAPIGGASLVGWLAAPVPDSVWPGKPLWIGLGHYVWSEVLERPGVGGVRAGLIGELYLNLWWPGIVVGMFLFGVLLRLLYVSLEPYMRTPNGAIVYAVVSIRLTIFALGGDLGTGITKALLDLVPVIILLRIVGRREGDGDAAVSDSAMLMRPHSGQRAVGPTAEGVR